MKDSPNRHTVAKWRAPWSSLGGRLALLVAVIVTGVVASVAYLEVRSFEGTVERELADTARLTAQSVVDTLGSRQPPPDPLDVRDTLHDLVAADPAVDAISVIHFDEAGGVMMVASTSTEEREEVVDLAKRALATNAAASSRGDTVLTVAMPTRVPGQAVAVTVGLEAAIEARAHGTRVALGFALPTVLLVTLLVHLALRRLVHRRLMAILRTMGRTDGGDLRARAPVDGGDDELAAIAKGLNGMLDRIEHANVTLQSRIEEATRDLALRNDQLAASYQQMLALREEVARAERVAALGQAAATIAHQAGTPLNLVSGYVQMIRDDPATSEKIRARLRSVETQIAQVTRVLRTMLDHARPSSGFEIIGLGDILERVREVAVPRLAQAKIRLRVAAAAGLPAIRANATQLEMALLNLVGNALDAMPDGGEISITATAVDDTLRLEVADTGPGIPPEIVDRVFEPWLTTKPAGIGSGLGLAIVRDVVRAHGGSVSAYNGAAGAVLVMELPAAAPAGSAMVHV